MNAPVAGNVVQRSCKHPFDTHFMNRKIPHEIVDRRAGDVAEVYADASLAEKELGWKAVHGIDKVMNIW